MSMQKKLKSKEKQLKLGRQNTASCPGNVCFSFCYMTSNSRYNFDYFVNSQKRESETIKANLYDRFEQLSKMTWLELAGLPKKQGFETIPIDSLNFQPSHFSSGQEKKAVVFRFKGVNGKDCRIIGIKEEHCSAVYHVIGYDFDYSAYDHG